MGYMWINASNQVPLGFQNRTNITV